MLGIGRTSLYALIDAGEITPIKIGRRTLVAESEIVRYVVDKLSAQRSHRSSLVGEARQSGAGARLTPTHKTQAYRRPSTSSRPA